MAPQSSPTPSLRAEFAKRLRELRVPRGYRTARAFANALGIEENRYTRYERAEVEPDLALLARICTVLSLTPNDLLGFARAPSGLPNGFAEDGATPIEAEHGHGGQDGAAAAAASRALSWHIACLLAAASVSRDDDAGLPLATLKLTAKIFEEIEADPFGFAMRCPTHPGLLAMPPERQAEIVTVMNELLTAPVLRART